MTAINNNNRFDRNNGYRFQLEPYHGVSSRYSCPACGAKGSFVRYIDTLTGEYVAPECGRCNRQDHCGYHLTPKEYFRTHHTNEPKEVGVLINDFLQGLRGKEKPQKLYTMEQSEWLRFYGKWSDLTYFLLEHFPHDSVVRAMQLYGLGGDGRGNISYPYIDQNQRLRSIKLMSYFRSNGHRSGLVYWWHSYLKRHGILPQEWRLSQCLFGEHLLGLGTPEGSGKQHPSICLVESEKTAVICSIVHTHHRWLATGSKGEFKPSKLLPLKNIDTKVYPDLNSFSDWQERATELNLRYGFHLHVSHFLEDIATAEERAQGLDLADFILMEKLKATRAARPTYKTSDKQ